MSDKGDNHNTHGARQHAKCPKGEQLLVCDLVVVRVLDNGGKMDHRLAAEQTEDERDEETDEAAVGVGLGHPEDQRQLREEDDVNEIRTQDVQAVDGGGEDGDGAAQDADHENGYS